MTLRFFPIPEKSFFINHSVVDVADLVYLTRSDNLTFLKNNRLVAKSSDLLGIMRYKENRNALVKHTPDFVLTLLTELCVTDGKNLVKDKNLRLNSRCDRKRCRIVKG